MGAGQALWKPNTMRRTRAAPPTFDRAAAGIARCDTQ
jgi:hypothetical protein